MVARRCGRSADRLRIVRLGLLVGIMLGGLAPLARWVAPLRAGGGTPTRLIGLTNGNQLLMFNSTTPGTITRTVSITGLQVGESIVAIDSRPLTSDLYGLGIVNQPGTDAGRLYRINPSSGLASLVGTGPFTTTLADGAAYGFDFNPTVDRIRIVNDADQNLRVNPITGALAGFDTNLDNPAGGENIVGSAYDRILAPGSPTTLYGIDASTSSLVLQGGIDAGPPGGSPNSGAITTVGALGVTLLNGQLGFDIAGDGTAYASMSATGGLVGLYTINLSTGAAVFSGSIGSGSTTVFGLTAALAYRTHLPLVARP